MTTQEKEKFFAQYWGQKILRLGVKSNEGRQYTINHETSKWIRVHKTSYLELRDLKDITDEDAIEVANIGDLFTAENMVNALRNGDHFVKDISKAIKSYQYLQSKGYALPYMQYSVEQLIEMGWVIIINN